MRFNYFNECAAKWLNLTVLFILITGATNICDASELYLRPSVMLGGGHDDNINNAYDVPGQNNNIEASTIYQTQADAEFGLDSGAIKTTLYARYWYQTVLQNQKFDADIAELRWNLTNTNEKSVLTMNIDEQSDTSLTSEFETSGISVDGKKDRHNLNGSLGYRWQLTPQDYINSEVDGGSVRYIDAQFTNLKDYKTKSYTATYGHSLSERMDIGTQISYSEFNIPLPQNNVFVSSTAYATESTSLALFGAYKLSERDTLSLQAGFRTSRFSTQYYYYQHYYGEQKDDGNGKVFSASYSRSYAASNISVSASRDLRPNGSGRVIEQDSFSVGTQYNFDERNVATASLSANRQREPVNRTSDDRDFAEGLLGERFNLSEEHAIAFEISHRWQQIKSANDITGDITGKGTAAYLRWYWVPRQISWH
jgi:hypothetical protein